MRYFFALLFLLGGVALTAYGFATINDSRASKGWPSVEGEIVESKVREILYKRAPNKTNLHERKYAPAVTYKYQVDGKEYQSKQISFNETTSRRESKVATAVAEYPIGSQHPVYYKPTKPKVAVLKPGMDPETLILPVIGIVLVLFGFIALKGALKRRTKI